MPCAAVYAAVPCYHLAALHDAIKHDLPHTPNGLWSTWTIIIGVFAKQREDPRYVMPVVLPEGAKTE